MYELVNTSLPNGLITGTHGFSTVAMTKGMPDSLRMRVEAYCAYSHRSSAHDETYYSENPVNWFHAILPQGEHIVGRVAPAEFDYTGRTNRLARLFVFPKDKMPLIGGVAVLLKKARRLQEPWSGEARWLDEDKETERFFRAEPVAATKDAPSWRKKFGDAEGLNYARSFARLLAKNVNGGGKPIYFKTSAAHDVSGGELLSLFADLINLLPTSVRAGITFSTYSAALPHGAVCHLRGVYDSDRAFDMAKVTQPWVDCETGKVHNAEQLPGVDSDEGKIQLCKHEESESTVNERPRSNPTISRRSKSVGGRRCAGHGKDNGIKRLIVVFVTLAILMAATFVVVALSLPKGGDSANCSTGCDNPTIKPIVGEVDSSQPKADSDSWRQVPQDDAYARAYAAATNATAKKEWDKSEIGKAFNNLKDAARKRDILPREYHSVTNDMESYLTQAERVEKLERKVKNLYGLYVGSELVNKLKEVKGEIDELMNALKDMHGLEFSKGMYEKVCKACNEIKESKNKENYGHEVFAFVDALEIKDKKYMEFDSMFGRNDKMRLTNGVMKVFYYDSVGVVTNAPAEYKKLARDSFVLYPKVKDMKTLGMMYLWYDTQTKVLYWDWSPLDKAKERKWFENDDEINLKEKIFGRNGAVFTTWTNRYKRTDFTIAYGEETQVITYTADMALKVDFFKPDVTAFEQKLDAEKEKQAKAEKELAQFNLDFDEWTKKVDELKEILEKREKLIKERRTKEKDLGEKKKARKKDVKAIEALEKKIEDLRSQISKASDDESSEATMGLKKELSKITREKFNESLPSGDITVDRLESCEKRIRGKKLGYENAVANAKKVVKELERQKEANNKNWRERIKQSEFKVTKIEGVPR